ncbi:MAG: hypothetical protein JWN85_2371, partial [Gammaproteobacteria bacterium]|nr:hypothetical protein [Gammaproteobacteria bacterium]
SGAFDRDFNKLLMGRYLTQTWPLLMLHIKDKIA